MQNTIDKASKYIIISLISFFLLSLFGLWGVVNHFESLNASAGKSYQPITNIGINKNNCLKSFNFQNIEKQNTELMMNLYKCSLAKHFTTHSKVTANGSFLSKADFEKTLALTKYYNGSEYFSLRVLNDKNQQVIFKGDNYEIIIWSPYNEAFAINDLNYEFQVDSNSKFKPLGDFNATQNVFVRSEGKYTNLNNNFLDNILTNSYLEAIKKVADTNQIPDLQKNFLIEYSLIRGKISTLFGLLKQNRFSSTFAIPLVYLSNHEYDNSINTQLARNQNLIKISKTEEDDKDSGRNFKSSLQINFDSSNANSELNMNYYTYTPTQGNNSLYRSQLKLSFADQKIKFQNHSTDNVIYHTMVDQAQLF